MSKESYKAKSRAHAAYLSMHRKDLFSKVANKDEWLPKNMPKNKSLKRHDMSKEASENLRRDLYGIPKVAVQRNSVRLMTYNPVNYGSNENEEKKMKAEVDYRKGGGLEKCSNCAHFSGGSDCSKVDGDISPDARCSLIEKENMGTMDKKAYDLKLGQRFFQERTRSIFEKVAVQATQGTVGANLASMLDGEVEENKRLREDIAKLQGAQSAAMASGNPEAMHAASMTAVPNMPGQNGSPAGMGDGPGVPVPGGHPASGMPAERIDPTSGLPVDPNTGMIVDPQTGQMSPPPPPPPPPPTPQEIQLQQSLQQADQTIQQLQKENQTIRDENRALHHAVEPDDMSDKSKKMYDRSGTNIDQQQRIPVEDQSRTKLEPGFLEQLIAKSTGGM